MKNLFEKLKQEVLEEAVATPGSKIKLNLDNSTLITIKAEEGEEGEGGEGDPPPPPTGKEPEIEINVADPPEENDGQGEGQPQDPEYQVDDDEENDGEGDEKEKKEKKDGQGDGEDGEDDASEEKDGESDGDGKDGKSGKSDPKNKKATLSKAKPKSNGTTTDDHDIIEDTLRRMVAEGKLTKEDAKAFQDGQDSANDSLAGEIKKTADNRKKMKVGDGGPQSTGGFGSSGTSEEGFDGYVDKLGQHLIDWNQLDGAVQKFVTITRRKMIESERKQKRLPKATRPVYLSKNKPEEDYARSIDNVINRVDMSHVSSNKVIHSGDQYFNADSKILFLVTLDVSGSVGASLSTIAIDEAQGIIDHMKRKFKVGGKEMVYFMSWSSGYSSAAVVPFKSVNAATVKNFKFPVISGGTDPGIIFEYIRKHTVALNDDFCIINLLETPNPKRMGPHDNIFMRNKELEAKAGGKVIIPDVLPFVLTITDAEFAPVTAADISPYITQANKDTIWWFAVGSGITNAKRTCFPPNIVIYEDSKI